MVSVNSLNGNLPARQLNSKDKAIRTSDKIASDSENKSSTDNKASSDAITANAKASILIKCDDIPEEYKKILNDFEKDSKITKLPRAEIFAILKKLASMETQERRNAEWLYHSFSDTGYIEKILDNPDSFRKVVKYAKFIVENDFLRQKSDKKLKNTLATRIAIMRYRDPQSWRNLVTSKGYKAITEGAVRLDFIKNLEADTVVDDNYFYNKFDDFETNTRRALAAMNVSGEFQEKFLKIADIDMSKVPKLLAAVNIMDKKLAVQLFDLVLDTKQKIDETAKVKYIRPSEYLDFFDESLKMLELAKNNQEAAKKLLQLEGKNISEIIKILERVDKERKNQDIAPIVTNVIDDFLQASADNKNFSIDALSMYSSKIDNFFTTDYYNKKIRTPLILGTICSNYYNGISSNNPDLKTFLSYIDKNNIQLLDFLVKEYPQKPEILEQQKMLLYYSYELGENSAKFFSSCAGIQDFAKLILDTANVNGFQYAGIVKEVLRIRLDSQELYEKLKNNGIFKLINDKTISIQILSYLNRHMDLNNNVYKDAEKVLKGESIVPEFSANMDKNEILRNTKEGDVLSIEGKMYINNGEKLVRWNISKEKYLELFPPVIRFASKQAQLGDCYFVSVLENMMSKPKFRVKLYEMFSQDGEDIIVHLKGLDGYRYENKVRFKNGNVEQFPHKQQLQGAKGFQMLEQAYAECALRERLYDIIPENETMSVKISRIKTGSERRAMLDLLGLNSLSKEEVDLKNIGELKGNVISIDVTKSKEPPEELLRDAGRIANKDNAMIFFSMKNTETTAPEKTINNEYNLVSNHTYAIKRYDEAADALYITNPWNCASDIKVPVSLLAQYISYISAGML